jgi:hypothetical protein
VTPGSRTGVREVASANGSRRFEGRCDRDASAAGRFNARRRFRSIAPLKEPSREARFQVFPGSAASDYRPSAWVFASGPVFSAGTAACSAVPL